MKIATLLKTLAVVVLIGGGSWIAANQWRYQTISGIKVRRHGLTGAVQLQAGESWAASGVADPHAPILVRDTLKTVQIRDAAFGKDDVVAFRAATAPGVPIQGRLAVRVVIRDSLGRVISRGDKSLRLTVDWPAGATIPVALDATREGPTGKQALSVTLESLNDEGNQF